MNKKSTASIIVLTYNNLSYTRQCLDSIYKKTEYLDFEVIVVDNLSTDGTRKFLLDYQQEHENFVLILNETNRGFSGGNNQGAAAASGEFLVFLNNDTVVTSGWLTGLLCHLQDHRVGMVGPVTNTSGNETRISVEYQTMDEMDAFAERYTQNHAGQMFEIRMLAFLCVAMRRLVFEEIGPLDERFGVGMFEDDDYAMRLKQRDYRILCVEDVFVHHWGSAGFSKIGFADYWVIFEENRKKFEQKWDVKWIPARYRETLLDEQLSQIVGEKRGLAFQVIERDQAIWELKKQISDLGAELFDTKNKLFGLYASTAWQIMKVMWRARLWLAPHGSRREEMGRLLMEGMHKLFGKIRRLRETLQESLDRMKSSRRLKTILGQNPSAREVVVFLPTIEWNTALFQRPHQLAMALARQGCLVFFCSPPESTAYPPGLHRIEDHLYIVQGVLDIFDGVRSPVLFGLVYNHHLAEQFTQPRFVYEYIDELDIFPGDLDELKRTHNKLVQSADLVIATADKLYEHVQFKQEQLILCPNGVDYAFVRQAMEANSEPPEEIAEIVQSGHPLIGYYGALAEWLDYRLLRQVAKVRPGYEFVLIGPDYDGSVLTNHIEEHPNIHWLGPKPYAILPGYLKYFNVATIPFRLNEVTHSTSPLKLFEYMAGGKPIVTTAMHECQKYPPVLIATDTADFAGKLDEALTLQNDPAYQRSLAEWAEKNGWDQRAAQILDALPARPRSEHD